MIDVDPPVGPLVGALVVVGPQRLARMLELPSGGSYDLALGGPATNAYFKKLYRDVKILDIGEGTQQVQRVVVARQLFGFRRDE